MNPPVDRFRVQFERLAKIEAKIEDQAAIVERCADGVKIVTGATAALNDAFPSVRESPFPIRTDSFDGQEPDAAAHWVYLDTPVLLPMASPARDAWRRLAMAVTTSDVIPLRTETGAANADTSLQRSAAGNAKQQAAYERNWQTAIDPDTELGRIEQVTAGLKDACEAWNNDHLERRNDIVARTNELEQFLPPDRTGAAEES